MKQLHFHGENSNEYLNYGLHLYVRPTADYQPGHLSKHERVMLTDQGTGQRAVAEVIGYVTGVTADRFDKFRDLIALGPSHVKTPGKLIEYLYEAYPDVPMDEGEWTFIGFKTYLMEVI